MNRVLIAIAIAVASIAGSRTLVAQGGVAAAQAALQGQQIDFSGSWANRLHEDWVERAPGSRTVRVTATGAAALDRALGLALPADPGRP